MASAMLTLAIDTAAAACQACIFDGNEDRVLGLSSEAIGRGHAELLISRIDDALAEAGLKIGDIDRLAVTVGPGSFTGIRVGVATARGLALALRCDCVGITCLEAVGHPAALASLSPVLASIDARRDQVYVELFGSDGESLDDPSNMSPKAAADYAVRSGAALAGSGAAIVAAASRSTLDILASGSDPIDIVAVARLASIRVGPFSRPSPLYLRGADAKPQIGFAVARKA